MSARLDLTDVAFVTPDDMLVPLKAAIARGQGLALINGLADCDIREIESVIWADIACPKTRLAVALRFRALLDVYASRRLKQLFLTNGFRLIAPSTRIAAAARLNVRMGFRPQTFLTSLCQQTRTAHFGPAFITHAAAA